jgi:hypothetical protein
LELVQGIFDQSQVLIKQIEQEIKRRQKEKKQQQQF